MAIVAEGERGRVYLSPTPEHEAAARKAKPEWKPDQPMNRETRDLVSGRGYGFFTWADLFTQRQLVTLTTFSDLVQDAMERVRRDALAAGLAHDATHIRDGGVGNAAYAEAVGLYCGLAVSKMSDYNSSLVVWSPTRDQAKSTFARQALPMVWDFAEANPFADAAGDINVSVEGMIKVLSAFDPPQGGSAVQDDAATQNISQGQDHFHRPALLRQYRLRGPLGLFLRLVAPLALRSVFPDLFATLAVPKARGIGGHAHIDTAARRRLRRFSSTA